MSRTSRLAAAVIAALLVSLPAAAEDASRSLQAKAYQASLKAIESGSFEAYKKTISKETSAGIEKDLKEMGKTPKDAMELFKMMAPSNVQYTGVKVDGKKATLSATGKMMDEPQYGSIDLVEENGAWKVGHQSWTNTKPDKK